MQSGHNIQSSHKMTRKLIGFIKVIAHLYAYVKGYNNIPQEGEAVLFWALRTDDKNLVSLLIQRGANINAQNEVLAVCLHT